MQLRLARALTCLFFVCCAAAQQPPAPPAPSAPPKVDPTAMVRNALRDQERMVDLLEKYSYSKRNVAQFYDKKGKVTSRAERVYSFAPCDGRQCITLVSVDARAPKPKELKEHEKDMKKMREQEAKKTAAEKQKEADEDLFLSKDFLAVYDFSDAGTDLYNGTAVQVVAFKPKEQKVELADKDNKVLTKMEGRLWITEVDQQILASEMHMVKPIKVWGGFAGAINQMTVQQEYIRESGMYLPKKSMVEMELRIMFSKGRMTRSEEYFDFKSPAPAAATTAAR